MNRINNCVKRLLYYFLSGIILFLLLSCRSRSGADNRETATNVAVRVKIATIVKGSIKRVETVQGNADANRHGKIVSPIAGRVLSIVQIPGTPVKKDAVIAVIRTKESDAALAGAQILGQQANTPEQTAEAQKAIALAESTQNTIAIRALFDGIIISDSSTPGEIVSEGAELITIIDPQTLFFSADIPLTMLPRIHSGQNCSIYFNNYDDGFPALIFAVEAQADPLMQSVKARIRFSPKTIALLLPHIKPGAAGEARIITAIRDNTMLAPKNALLRNDETNTYSLVTITADSLSKTIEVAIGIIGDSLVEIISNNVFNGMPLITEGNYGLADSTRIRNALPGDR